MSDSILEYYERELTFIRRLAREFAQSHPLVAERLQLEANRSTDPHVERLIEGFALLAGRVHHKLDDEFPELTDALLGVLYPHYLAPVPSVAVVQFEPDPDRVQLPEGFAIPRHSRLHTQPLGGLDCRFRTGYPVTLWPVAVTAARLQPAPFPANLQAPPGAKAALRLQLECQGELGFADLSLDRLRFHLAGDEQPVAKLYELLFNHPEKKAERLPVLFRPLDRNTKAAAFRLDPEECLHQVGFEPDEGLLPYPGHSFPGYRLLTEFFAYPAKFLFLDLGGWRRAAAAGFGHKAEVVVFFRETNPNLEQAVDEHTFRLGSTPVVNLFEYVIEPAAITHTRLEYLLKPDVAYPGGLEIYSVDQVTAAEPGATIEYEPFYSFRHGRDRARQRAFWYASRRRALDERDRGTDVYLTLVDLDFNPRRPAEANLVVRTTCTNRDLPLRLQKAGEALYFELETAAPLKRDGVRCLRSPSGTLRPPLRRGAYWRLVSHLALNHLSLSDPEEGRAALQEILRLYDFADPESERQLSEVSRQIIEGITAVSSRRAVGRVNSPTASGFCRGLDVTIEFDETNYVGTGVFLFASVLERFLGLYASLNSFTRLIARTKQREGDLKRWPPRAGELPLL